MLSPQNPDNPKQPPTTQSPHPLSSTPLCHPSAAKLLFRCPSAASPPPQFVSLTLSRLKYRPDSALRDLDRVLAVLGAAGPDLLRMLRSAEVAFNDFALPLVRPAAAAAGGGGGGAGGVPQGYVGGGRRGEGEFAELVPWWFEQVRVLC